MEILHLEVISQAIGLMGAAIIVWGLAVAFVRVVGLEFLTLRGQPIHRQRLEIRQILGYYLLLGLEFLVAADIVHTILDPTLSELAILGAIVAIRTTISFSLNRELAEAG